MFTWTKVKYIKCVIFREVYFSVPFSPMHSLPPLKCKDIIQT